jgi:hypothetical protein
MAKTAIYLEIGQKRTFASGLEWPGWCRSGRDVVSAMDALLAAAPRYAQALERAGLHFPLPGDRASLEIVERLPGSPATEFGVPEAHPAFDLQPLEQADFDRFLSLLSACWQALASAASAGHGKELRTGPRGGGRSLEKIVEHVLGAEAGYLSRLGRKLAPVSAPGLSAEIMLTGQAALDSLAAAVREGIPERGPRGGKMWTVRYFVRRSAWHILDHAWEIEDRIL